jgi:hypothetical protein
MTSQDRGYCLPTDRISELSQLSLYLVIAKRIIFLGNADDETLELLVNLGSASTSCWIVRPLPTHQLAMPFQDGFWLEDLQVAVQLARCTSTNRFQLVDRYGQSESFRSRGPDWLL